MDSRTTKKSKIVVENVPQFIFEKAMQWFAKKLMELNSTDQYTQLIDYLELGLEFDDKEKQSARNYITSALIDADINPEEVSHHIEDLISRLDSIEIPPVSGYENSTLALKELSKLNDEGNQFAMEGWSVVRVPNSLANFSESNLYALTGWLKLQKRIQLCLLTEAGVENNLHQSSRVILQEGELYLRGWKFYRIGFVENNKYQVRLQQFTQIESDLNAADSDRKFIADLFSSWRWTQEVYSGKDSDHAVIAHEKSILDKLNLLSQNERLLTIKNITDLLTSSEFSPLMINKILLHGMTLPLALWTDEYVVLLTNTMIVMRANSNYPNEFADQLQFLVLLRNNPDLIESARMWAPNWYFPCNLTGITDSQFFNLINQYTSIIGTDDDAQKILVDFYNILSSFPPEQIFKKVDIIVAAFPSARDASERANQYNPMLAVLVSVIPYEQKINVLDKYFCQRMVDDDEDDLSIQHMNIIVKLLPQALHWEFIVKHLDLIDSIDSILTLLESNDPTTSLSFDTKVKLLENKSSLLTNAKKVSQVLMELSPQELFDILCQSKIRNKLAPNAMLPIIEKLPLEQQMQVIVIKLCITISQYKSMDPVRLNPDDAATRAALLPLREKLTNESDTIARFNACYEVIKQNESLSTLSKFVIAFSVLHEKQIRNQAQPKPKQ